jgi:hypothetical protein
MNAAQNLLNQILSFIKLTNNPMAKNVVDMARNGNISGIETFGRNIAKERGVDFDTAFQNFKAQFQR